jgi:cell division protein FtsQ
VKLERDQNLFDPLGPVEARAEALAGVVSARIDRRLPGTLRVTIVERQAIAFAPGPDGLIALDGEGQPLPYDPASTGLDLALVRRADPAVLGTLARIRGADSTLYQVIDAASRGRDGAVNVDVGPRRLVVRALPTPDEVRAVGTVRRHLTATGRPYLELDARYAGWVIARRSRS